MHNCLHAAGAHPNVQLQAAGEVHQLARLHGILHRDGLVTDEVPASMHAQVTHSVSRFRVLEACGKHGPLIRRERQAHHMPKAALRPPSYISWRLW